ncbi:hypothetical protein NSQ29_11525 [Paenibacillus sp. FSL F4-0236]|uniref:hypothetical protein n=1 Tax=Paenibacillus TaxID=44249 RepID=UPI0015C2E97A|nr:hypothetical protein [Paenibacillus odorifer]
MTEYLWPIKELPICTPGFDSWVEYGVCRIGLLFAEIGVVRLRHAKQYDLAGCSMIDRNGIDEHAPVAIRKCLPIVLRDNVVRRPVVTKISADRVGDVIKHVRVVVVQIFGCRAQYRRSAILTLSRQGGTTRMRPPEIIGAIICIDPFRIDTVTSSGCWHSQSRHKTNEQQTGNSLFQKNHQLLGHKI